MLMLAKRKSDRQPYGHNEKSMLPLMKQRKPEP
jgi:hypothetical protein